MEEGLFWEVFSDDASDLWRTGLHDEKVRMGRGERQEMRNRKKEKGKGKRRRRVLVANDITAQSRLCA